MICAYAISKNEESNVHQFIEQTKFFDQVCVLDTGSTDRTVEFLRKANITVQQKVYKDFDFSQARHDALALANPECQWFFTLDFNEKLEITNEHIDKVKSSSYDGFKIDCYDFFIKDYYEQKLKLHRRDSYSWKYAVHEYLESQTGNNNTGQIDIKITKKTRSNPYKSTFYAEICEREHKKYPLDPHYSWWVLNYYFTNKNYERCFHHSQNYIDNTVAYTNEFRIYAFLYISRCFLIHNHKNQAIDYAFHALSESIKFRETVPACFAKVVNYFNEIGLEIKIK